MIVVSHDREFAEQYADRIIELSDGVVISDVELSGETPAEEPAEQGLLYEDHTITVPAGYHITEEDRAAINEYLRALEEGGARIVVSGGKKTAARFVKTDESKIKRFDGAGFQLIKSKLPLKNAFQIGASGLKYKKFRLVITILLSCVAFGLFGLSDTFGAYNHINTCTKSLSDSGVQYLPVGKAKEIGNETTYTYWRDYGYRLSREELGTISKGTGVQMHGAYSPDTGLDFTEQINPEIKLSETDYQIYASGFNTMLPMNQTILQEMNFKVLAGTLPDGGKNEIAVSEYVLETFKKAQYFDGVTFTTEKDGTKKPVYQTVQKAEDLIGKELTLGGQKYTVTAVVDTGFDLARYEDLIVGKQHRSREEQLLEMVLASEFQYASSYSYAGAMMVGDGFIEKMIAAAPARSAITEGYIWFNTEYNENEKKEPPYWVSVDSNYLARLEDVKGEKIVWVNGEKTTLGEKEILVSTDCLSITSSGEEGMEITELPEMLKAIKNGVTLNARVSIYQKANEETEASGYKIVGLIETGNKKSAYNSTVVCADSLFESLCEGPDHVYQFAVGKMPENRDAIKTAVAFCYQAGERLRYPIQNSVTFELDSINEVLKELSKYFFYIGIGFALFAALMLANFIGTSITYKKQEIGILRAIGSRGNDVFRIFFAESFIIAMINFVLSAIGVFVVTGAINLFIRERAGLLVTVLNFGVRQVVLLLAVSLLVAFVASFLPVKRIASKKPIDAIRNR